MHLRQYIAAGQVLKIHDNLCGQAKTQKKYTKAVATSGCVLDIEIIETNDHIIASVGEIELIGPWNICGYSLKLIFFSIWYNLKNRCPEQFLWNCPQVNATRPHWWLVNIGPGNGMVLSGTCTNIYQILWHDVASLGHELWQDFVIKKCCIVYQYHQISNISCTLGGNKLVDYSGVVGASPVDAASTTLAKTRREIFKFWDLVCLIFEADGTNDFDIKYIFFSVSRIMAKK